MNKQVVGGIRVSTDAQKEMYGPERQRQDIEREAERAGLEIIDWVEESISGANHDRASENRYYELARQTAGLNFMFSHPNRVGRHVEVIVGIARQIHNLGGTVWIAGLGNLRDPRNWRYFLKDAADAEIDYSNIVHQMVSGKRSKAMSGRWPHGEAPFGYTLERDHRGRSLLPKPNEYAFIVRRIFEISLHSGQVEVLKVARAEDWPSPSGQGWSITTVGNILRNERYTGRAIFQGITLDFEPIISRELWEDVQAARTSRQRASGPRDHSLLWSGHVRCAVCGAAIGRDQTRTKYGRYVYYRCWRSKAGEAQRHTWEQCANSRAWVAATADTDWWCTLVEQILRPDVLPTLLPPTAAQNIAPPPARVAELETSIARAWEPFAAGKITEAVAERIAAPFVAELERLRLEYAPRAEPEPDYAELHRRLAKLFQSADTQELQRDLLDIYAIQLYVGQDGVERVALFPPV